MKFNVSTVLLTILLIAVTIGWIADRFKHSETYRQHLATIVTPAERLVIRPEDPVPVEGIFLNARPSETLKAAPLMVIELVSPRSQSFVIANSAIPVVTQRKNDPRVYDFTIELPRPRTPYRVGEYLLQAKIFVDSEMAVCPTRTIIVEPTGTSPTELPPPDEN